MLALFFAAHALVTAALVLGVPLGVWQYQVIPLLFAALAVACALPPLGRRLRRGSPAWRVLPVVAYAGIISLASAVRPRAALPGASYVFHPLEYAGLAWVALHAVQGGLHRPLGSTVARRHSLLILGAGLLFAGLDELHQAFVPGRVCSLADVGLDAGGLLLGLTIFAAMATFTPKDAVT